MENITHLLFISGIVAVCDDCGKAIDANDKRDCLAYFDSSKCDCCMVAEMATV